MRCFIVMGNVNVWNDRRMLNVILCRWFLVCRAAIVRNRIPRDRLLQPMTDYSKTGQPWSTRTTRFGMDNRDHPAARSKTS